MDTEKPCGRKAQWIVIGDVLDGGTGFVATCRECYEKGLGHISPESNDDLILASAFRNEFGRDPMCGDDEGSPGVFNATFATTEGVKEDALSHREFARWRAAEAIRASVHRIAIHRRFDRIEWSVRILANVAAAGAAFYVGNMSKKWLTWGGEWTFGAVALPVYFLTDRYIRLGRFTKYLKIK